MKSHLVMGLLSLGSLASCQEKDQPVAVVTSEKKWLPGQVRAKKAVENVRPVLERDLAAAGLHFGDPVFIRAFKNEGELELFVRSRATGKFDLFRTYQIAGQSGVSGPKLAEGDGQVPEGFYFVPPGTMNPNSQYHLSFNLGYPNEYDRAHQRTGSAIMIHGDCVSIGCLAMTDEKIEEIYTLCAAAHDGGQAYFRVHLFPFRMTAERMEALAEPAWNDFWRNLKEGYDFFEKNRVPPEVSVVDRRYEFK
ncbi:MAG: L,D-transpeptidase family protein [Luteolibacter sp.]